MIRVMVILTAAFWFAFAGILTAVLVCPRPSTDMDKASVEQSIILGNHVVTMLEEFRSKTGSYPTSLEELERDGVIVPPPTAGTRVWGYSLRSDGSFILSFESRREFPAYWITSESGEWCVDTG